MLLRAFVCLHNIQSFEISFKTAVLFLFSTDGLHKASILQNSRQSNKMRSWNNIRELVTKGSLFWGAHCTACELTQERIESQTSLSKEIRALAIHDHEATKGKVYRYTPAGCAKTPIACTVAALGLKTSLWEAALVYRIDRWRLNIRRISWSQWRSEGLGGFLGNSDKSWKKNHAQCRQSFLSLRNQLGSSLWQMLFTLICLPNHMENILRCI